MLLFSLSSKQYILVLSLVLVAKLVLPQPTSCPASADEEALKTRRIQGLRAHILAQLGLSEPPKMVNFTKPSQEELETFREITAASKKYDSRTQGHCNSAGFFASPINSFVGTVENISEGILTIAICIYYIYVLCKLDCILMFAGSLGKRSIATLGNELSVFELTFNISLPEELLDVTSAELLLYQVPLPVNDDITDDEQYIELRCVHESGVKTVVVTKTVNIYESGYKVFDILSVVKSWIAKRKLGLVHLELSIMCTNSTNCAIPSMDELKPVPATFVYQASHRKPRIVLTSKNPLEATHGHRFKKQTRPGKSFCTGNESTCCLKPLTIKFSDIGLGFISEPLEIEANYCDGVCPISPGGELLTPQLFEFLSRLRGNPASAVEPCCAGNSYHNMPVMVQMEEGVFKRDELIDVRVTSCRCG